VENDPNSPERKSGLSEGLLSPKRLRQRTLSPPCAEGTLHCRPLCRSWGYNGGLRRAGFSPVVAVESTNGQHERTRANFGDHVLACPIEDVKVKRVGGVLVWRGFDVEGDPLEFETPEIDVLVGGPPCQASRPSGRMNDWDYADPATNFGSTTSVSSTSYDRSVLLENVPELLKSRRIPELRASSSQANRRL